MALLADYTAGTVTSSGTTITGSGTGWLAANFQEGDIFIAQGYWAIVSQVVTNSQIILVDWAGPALTGSVYRLRYMSDGSRASAQARQLIDLLGGSGNIEALSGLTGLPNMVPVFTGPGTMELRSYTAGLIPRGAWDSETVYNRGDLVTYMDNAFGSVIENNQGNTPPATATNDASWQFFPAAPGPEGPTGPAAPLSIGTVVTGMNAAATITGTVPNQQLNLTLPRGNPGTPGLQGDKGDTGNAGPANSLSIGTVSSGTSASATITGTAPTQTLNLTLPRGDPGLPGTVGWTPVFAVVADGGRFVQQVVNWVGGEGAPPESGEYVGPTGFVEDIALAVNIRGAAGSGSGDMQISTYDPQNVSGDAFLRANHTGTQAIATISGLQTALDDKYAQPTGGTGQYIRGDGSIATFPAIPAGTVTSVGLSVPTGFSVSGSPVTGSGTLSLSYTAGYTGFTTTLQTKINGVADGATANSSDAFLLARGNHTGSQLASTISDFSTAADSRISSAIGVSVQAYSAALASFVGLAANGHVVRTTANTYAVRTITGTTGQIEVVNGNGVSGNPTLSLPTTVVASLTRADTALQPAVNANLTAGYTATAVDDGTKSSGTYTPTPAGGNLKRCVNGGAFTLAAPTASGDYTLVIQVTNNGSAGAITLSGFSKTGGDAFTTTNGDDFFVFVAKINGFTSAVVQALQ